MTAVPFIDPGTRRHTENTVYGLARTIRERDIITYEHSRRVAVYVYRLARHLGWSRRAGRDLALAAIVHDLGKTWMQNDVLHKASALSPNEREEMNRHPQIGARILQVYGVPANLIDVVLHHHEAFDGHGYPDGLAGDAIPLGARLLSVADVYDALTSARPYKEAMDQAHASARIARGAGSHFDPAVVNPFLRLLDSTPDFSLPPRVCAFPIRRVSHQPFGRLDSLEY